MLRRTSTVRASHRRGVVLPLTAILLVVLVGFVAFAVDLGYIAMARTQMQAAADATALATVARYPDDNVLKGAGPRVDHHVKALQIAREYASVHLAAGKSIDLLDADIEIGYAATRSPLVIEEPGTRSPNIVRVTLRRDDDVNGQVGLFFANVLGVRSQRVVATATAWMENGVSGFRIRPGSGMNCSILPYTVSEEAWDDLFSSGGDQFVRDPDTGAITPGQDGIRELKLFPLDAPGHGNGVTPGNFGTLDIGSCNNSTADLARQIVEGPNEADFAHLPNQSLTIPQEGLKLNGDTGISAGVKDELASIRGKPRIIPLYKKVSGNGNNAQYTITRFVGCTVLDVKLTGSLSSKHVLIQPCHASDRTAIPGGGSGTVSQFVHRPLALIE